MTVAEHDDLENGGLVQRRDGFRVVEHEQVTGQSDCAMSSRSTRAQQHRVGSRILSSHGTRQLIRNKKMSGSELIIGEAMEKVVAPTACAFMHAGVVHPKRIYNF